MQTGGPAQPARDGEAGPAAGESISRNAAWALANQLTTAAFTAFLTLFLVRALEPRQYGEFALAVAIAGLLEIPSDLGISSSAARFVAARRGDPAAVAAVTATALRLKLAVSAVVTAGLVAGAGAIAGAYGQPGLAWPVRGIALALFGQSLFGFFTYSFIALRRISMNTRIIALESAMEASASVALVLLGAGAAGAAFGRAAGYLFGAAVGAVAVARVLGRRAVDVRRNARGMRRPLMSYAGTLAVVDVSWTVFAQIDVLLIGGILSTTDAGMFQAPMRLLVFLGYPTAAIASAVAPRLAGHGQGEDAAGAMRRACRLIVLVQAALVAPLVVWAQPIVDLLLGRSYTDSADVLRALAPYAFLLGLGPLVSTGLDYLGEARRRIPIVLGALAVNLAIDLVLISRIGIVAGAIGSDVAFALYVPAHLVIALRLLGVPLAPLAASAGRAALAALAMGLTLAAFGVDHVALWALAVGGVAGLAVYAAVLVATRELAPAELRRGWRAALAGTTGRPPPSDQA